MVALEIKGKPFLLASCNRGRPVVGSSVVGAAVVGGRWSVVGGRWLCGDGREIWSYLPERQVALEAPVDRWLPRAAQEPTIFGVRTAFKEWAIVIDALGRGEQIIILRKGGISEGRAGFQVDHPRFLLFPTLYHQQRESVLPEAQRRYDEIAPFWPGPDMVRIEYFAEVVSWFSLDNLAAAHSLQGQHIWREEVIAQRFEWGRSRNIFALAVRVYRLGTAAELPVIPSYGGCKSWVELANDLETVDAHRVIDDAEFASQLERFRATMDVAPK